MSQFKELKKIHKKGEFQQAIDGYQDLLKKDKDNSEIHYTLADANMRLENGDKALQHIQDAITLQTDSEKYHQLEGQILLSLQRFDDAEHSFKSSLKHNPNLFFSYMALGDIYLVKKKLDKARQQYKLALRVHEDGVPAAVKIAKLDLLQGKHDQALQDLLVLESQYPENIELKLHLGITRLETGETGFAELYFNKILEHEPDQALAKAYLAISLVNSDQKKAVEIISELSSLHPNAAEVQIAFGMYYHATGNYQKAIQHLYAASQTELAYPSWTLTLAHSLTLVKQNEQAISVLNALVQRTNLASAQAALGMIYHSQNNFDKALMTYNQLSSDYKEFNTVLVKKAECQYHLKQFEKCIETADIVLNGKDYYADAIKVKLHALVQLKQNQTAVNLINTQKASNNSKDFNNLLQLYAGLLCDANKDYQPAQDYFKKIQYQMTPKLTQLTADHKAIVKNWHKQVSKDSEPKPIFILSDPATGHHDVCRWLQENNITVLLDRFGINPRKDFLNRKWTIEELQKLEETKLYLLRRKYRKNLSHMRMESNRTIVDILPFNIVSAVILKRIYPDAHIVVLSRNSADMALHQKIFGVGLVNVETFKTMQSQMIAIGLDPVIIDIDQFKTNKQTTKSELDRILGIKTSDFTALEVTALETNMMPYMHWRNYKELID